MKREQLKQLAVAGTVTFPATYPRLAEIRIRRDRPTRWLGDACRKIYLVAKERPSVRVTMKRVIPLAEVRAVFVPRDPRCVHLEDGTWWLGAEVEEGMRLKIANGQCVYGIVYVAEQAATLLEVEAGLTAAESAQYYPPLPCDRSVNHYDPYRNAHCPPPAQGQPVWPVQDCPDRSPVCEPSVCEPDEERVSYRAPYCEPDECEPPIYKTLQSRRDLPPNAFPSVEKPQ